MTDNYDTILDAAIKGDIALVDDLLEQGCRIDVKDVLGKGLLYHAASGGHVDLIHHLIDKGLPVNGSNASRQEASSALLCAASGGKTEACLALIERGVDPDFVNQDGWTPLIVAKYNAPFETFEALCSAGADIHKKNKHGQGLLHHDTKREENAFFLIEKGIDVNAKDNDGSTPLHSAAIIGSDAYRALLIKKGAQINAKNKYGSTPLHVASANGKAENCLDLIGLGADLDAMDNSHRTPLHRAFHSHQRDRNINACMVLIAHGADPELAALEAPCKSITQHQAAAIAGLTQRCVDLIKDFSSHCPGDSLESMARLALENGKAQTAAVLQSMMAMQSIETLMKSNAKVVQP